MSSTPEGQKKKGRLQRATSDRKVVRLTQIYRKLNAGARLTKRELEALRTVHPAAAAEAEQKQKQRDSAGSKSIKR